MKTIAAAVIVLCVFSATQIFAGQRGVSGRFGSVGASRLSGSAGRSATVHTGFRQPGSHPRFGGTHFRGPDFKHHGHPPHGRFFRAHHGFPHHGFFFHRCFVLHPRFFFGHRAHHSWPSSVVIWSDPSVVSGYEAAWPALTTRAPLVEEKLDHQAPLITLMLRHRKELELTPEQVQGLERLRDDYQREAIRSEAELRIGEMELEELLKAEPVDVEKVKVKLQEVERLRVDLRFARIRAIEEGKALLSAEQREKLQSLLREPRQLGLMTDPARAYGN